MRRIAGYLTRIRRDFGKIQLFRSRIFFFGQALVSALIGKKDPGREVIRRCLNGQLNPVISNALYSEYQDVTRRTKVVDLCPLAEDEIQELLNAFYSIARWVSIHYLWRPNLIDEGDNFIIELAIASPLVALLAVYALVMLYAHRACKLICVSAYF